MISTNDGKSEAQRQDASANQRRKEILNDLVINAPRDLEVRFSRKATLEALIGRLKEAVLRSLIECEPNGLESARRILSEQGLAPADPGSVAVTALMEKRLSDARGEHAMEAIRRVLEQRGVEAALRRIRSLSADQLGLEAMMARAQDTAQTVVNALDRLGSFGTHRACLSQINEAARPMLANASQQSAEVSDRIQRLREEINRHSPRRHEGESEQIVGGRLAGVRAGLTGILKRLHERFRPSSRVRMEPMPEPSNQRILQYELVAVELQLAVFQAEEVLLGELCNLLDGEIERDEQALTFLRYSLETAGRAAATVEACDGYGIAAGEMLLGGREFTQAVFAYLWPEDDDTRIPDLVSSLYAQAHDGRGFIDVSGGEINAEIVSDIDGIIRNIVHERMRAFSVSDGILALVRHGDCDFQRKLAQALKQTAATDFLAPYYEACLDLQKFAAVAYPPCALDVSNSLFEGVLEEALKSVPFNVERVKDDLDSERLTFDCRWLCVPWTAFAAFDESYDDFERFRGDPFFNPHPELIL